MSLHINNNQSVICVTTTLWKIVGSYVEALIMFYVLLNVDPRIILCK